MEVGGFHAADDGPSRSPTPWCDEGFIGETEKFQVGYDAIGGGKLAGVVVIAEHHSCRLDLLSHRVELLGVVVPIVHGHLATTVCAPGWGRGLEAGARADEVLDAEFLVEGDVLVEVRLEGGKGHMGARAAQVCFLQSIFDLRGRVLQVPCGLDLSIAEAAEKSKRSLEVLRQLLTDREELKAEGQTKWLRVRASGLELAMPIAAAVAEARPKNSLLETMRCSYRA